MKTLLATTAPAVGQRLGRIERRILEFVERDEHLVRAGQGFGADEIVSVVYGCWPHRDPTRAEYVSTLRAMHSFVRKFPKYALIGGKGGTPLVLYDTSYPQSVAAAKEATKPLRFPQSKREAKGRWHRAKVRHEKPVTLTQREAAEIVALVEELARAKKQIEQFEGDGDKANEVLARHARRARAKGIEIQYTATLSDLLWTYTATINRACRVRTSVARVWRAC
jgi:hypothetical protein